MKNKFTYLLTLFVAILLITGFKSDDTYFPAPLDGTIAAFYLNFAKTGIYKDAEGSNKSRFVSDINYICKIFGQSETVAESFLNSTFLNGMLKLKEIYAYYADPMSFSIVLTGKIDIDEMCKTIGEENVKRDGEYASTVLNYEVPGNQRLFIAIMPEMIVMCPENITGNIMDNIIYERNKVKDRLPVFYNSVLSSSYTSLEARINDKEIRKLFPSWLKKLKQINFRVASTETSLQMLFTSQKEMNKATEPVKESLSSFESSLSESERFALNTENSGIYISANNSDVNLARTILNRTAAFLMHFFISTQSTQEIATKIE